MIVASGSPAVERIAVFLDGTWNTVNDNTKVWRLKALCALECQNDGLQQCLYYNPGVGTKYGEKIRGGILTNRARDNGDIRRGERAFTSAVAGWRDQLSTF
jgi:hypothetical protein